MRPAYLLVCGHANIDLHLKVDEIPQDGMSTPVRDRRTTYGGTAANIARAAAALGVPTRLYARVGADFPDAWRRALVARGLELCLDEDPEGRTPHCTILTDPAGHQAFCMDQGAMGDLPRRPADPALLAGLTGWLHIATGPPAGYERIVAAAREQGVPVAFDPGQELRFQYDARTLERFLDRADAVFLNRHELDVALRLLSYGDPEQLLDHVPLLVVTRGEGGASLHRRDEPSVHLPAFPARRVVDPTGAGDSLRAGWYAALQGGHDPVTALRWGQAAASWSLEHDGGQHDLGAEDLLLRLDGAK